MNTGEDTQGLRKIIDMTRAISIIILALHFYSCCYGAFEQWHWTPAIVTRVVTNISKTGLFRNSLKPKLAALICLVVSLIGAKGRKDDKLQKKPIIIYLLTGLLLYFISALCFYLKTSNQIIAISYMGITITGYMLILTGGGLLSRLIKDKLNKDIFNTDNETFPQEERLLQNEYSITVRTEHAIVVLLDAYSKGYTVDFKSILDSLLKETNSLDFSKPDKALESSYDTWAMAQILHILHEDSLSKIYLAKAANWKTYWDKDFKDLTKPDVDDLNARNMYQGTIWQYRWFAPFDVRGLIEQCGGEAEYLKQLDAFFAGDYYNAANEPDIQVPYLYNGTSQLWKSQDIIHKYAKDTVIQYYYDDNYRGINPTIDRVYNNRPDGFVNSMDDDMGAMSAWYVLAAIGISPACPGWPVYYLSVPLFKTVTIRNLKIRVTGSGRYIRSATLNGKSLDRDWITQQEIMRGGSLNITASSTPNKNFGVNHQWLTSLTQQ